MFGGHHVINMFGAIEPGDCDRFLNFLQESKPPARSDVYISSEGGSVADAIRMGLLIRGGSFSTHVGMNLLDHDAQNGLIHKRLKTNAICFSAATLVYLGGRLRFLDDNAKFGVHQFSYKNPSPSNVSDSQVLSAEIAHYLAEMGIHPRFLELSASVPSTKIEHLDKETLVGLGIVTGGETSPVWTTLSRNGLMYVRGERDSLYGRHKVMLAFARNEGFLFWANIQALGRGKELCDASVVEIVLNGENTRIDISNRSERRAHRDYVDIIAKLSVEEAAIVANSQSIGVQVRASYGAKVFLGVSEISTEDGADQLRSFFNTLS